MIFRRNGEEYLSEEKKERDFYLYGQVDQPSALELTKSIKTILRLDDEGREKLRDFKEEPIRLFINSYGGEVDSMFALINIIQTSKTPIYTYCTGVAASAAFQIFLAGHKRFAYKNTRMMYHQIQVCDFGYHAAKEIADNVKENEHLQECIEKFVADRTKLLPEQLRDIYDCKKEWWIHSDEYFKWGIVDEVLDV